MPVKTKLPHCVILAHHSIPHGEADRFKLQIQILKQFTLPGSGQKIDVRVSVVIASILDVMGKEPVCQRLTGY